MIEVCAHIYWQQSGISDSISGTGQRRNTSSDPFARYNISRINYLGTCFVPSKYVLIYLPFPLAVILSDGCLQVKIVQYILMTFNQMRRYIKIKVIKIQSDISPDGWYRPTHKKDMDRT